MLSILKHRNFRYLWLGGLVSTVGDYALYIALPFYIYNLTGSALATGLMFIIETIPGLFVGPFAGVFADIWNNRNIMIISDIIRGVVILLLIMVQSIDYLWIIYVVAFLQSVTSKFFYPAKNKLLPRLLGKEKLVLANSLDSMSTDITSLIGPSLGGLLMISFGIFGIVVIDSLSFFISAMLIWNIRSSAALGQNSISNTSTSLLSKLNIWNDWVNGIRVIGSEFTVISIFILMSIIMFGQGIISVLLFVFVQQALGGGSLEMGWMISAQGIGGIIGGLIMAKYGNRLLSVRTIILGFSLTGILLTIMANMTQISYVLLILPFVGITVVCAEVSVSTFFQKSTPDEYRGRITSSYRMTISIIMMAGMAFATLSGDYLKSSTLITIAGVIFIFGALVMWFRSYANIHSSSESSEA